MEKRFGVVPYDEYDAALNMAIDEILYDSYKKNTDATFGGYLRFYGFVQPSITCGYFQNMQAVETLCAGRNYDRTRRMTGGGLVVHEGGLTVSVVTHRTLNEHCATADTFYKMFHLALFKAFASIGLECTLYTDPGSTGPRQSSGDNQVSQCFTAPVPYDLMYQGAKIAGRAQKRSRGFMVHQGSIEWQQTPLKENPVKQRLLQQMIMKHFEDIFECRTEPALLDDTLMSCARECAAIKYSTDEWRYKFS